MRALVLSLFLLALPALAAPDSPQMDWPLYRLGIRSEQWRIGLDEAPRYPWARALAEKRGALDMSIKEQEAALYRIERFERLAELRWHLRTSGPPPIDVWGEQKGVVNMSMTKCRRLWAQPAARPAAFHALSEFKGRPLCLLQEIPDNIHDLEGKGDTRPVAVATVGDAKQTFTRLTGNPGSGDAPFRALYDQEGRLVSAQIQSEQGWVMVTRDATGAYLVERPAPNKQHRAELIFVRPTQSGLRGMDLGVVRMPARPAVPGALIPLPGIEAGMKEELACPILDAGQTYIHSDGTFVGPHTRDIKLSGTVQRTDSTLTLMGSEERGPKTGSWRLELTQVQVNRRGGMVFFSGREGVLSCSLDGQLDRGRPRYPWVSVKDAGAGSATVRAVRDVLALTLAAEYEQRADEVLVMGRGKAMMSLDHIEISYNDRKWAEEAWRMRDSLRLALPWSAIVVREWTAGDAPVTVSVGW